MHRSLFVLLAFLWLAGCGDPLAYSSFKATAGGRWDREQVMEFEVTDLDTVSDYTMYIMLRNDDTFPYSNLFLIAEMTGPQGQSQRDTLEYEMADAEGRWLGSGYGSVVENKLGYKKDVVFPVKGVYTVRISQAMRKNGSVRGVESLPGILDVGLQIEKNE
jgi:gliding motility-associated lipoprotein GldH